MAQHDNPSAKTDPAVEFKNRVQHYLDFKDYVKDIREDVPFFPQHIHVEPTNACNLRCVHCHHHEVPRDHKVWTRKPGIMDMAIYRKVIDEAAHRKTAVTLNVQGEPTLHPHFLEMCTYAKQSGVHLSVLTNGTRLTEQLAQALVDIGLDRIVFSFDAVEKNLYESIRVRARFEPTMRNVLNFMRINQEQGHPTHVCMSMIIQERNKDHVHDYDAFCRRLPVDAIFHSSLLTLSGISGCAEEIDIRELQSGQKETWPVCRVPWETLTINWDGLVSACPIDVNVVYSAGNVRDMSMMEIWNNQRMRQFRRAHLLKDYSLVEENGPLCSTCNCLWDPDYDLKRYGEHTVEAICRLATQFAHRLSPQVDDNGTEKYQNLLKELDQLPISMTVLQEA